MNFIYRYLIDFILPTESLLEYTTGLQVYRYKIVTAKPMNIHYQIFNTNMNAVPGYIRIEMIDLKISFTIIDKMNGKLVCL